MNEVGWRLTEAFAKGVFSIIFLSAIFAIWSLLKKSGDKIKNNLKKDKSEYMPPSQDQLLHKNSKNETVDEPRKFIRVQQNDNNHVMERNNNKSQNGLFIVDKEDISNYVFGYKGEIVKDEQEIFSLWRKGIFTEDTSIFYNKNPKHEYKIKHFPGLIEILNNGANQQNIKKLKTNIANCPNCSSEVSIRAKSCPHCNFILKKECALCKNEINFDSKICLKCGDPNPFVPVVTKQESRKCYACGSEIYPSMSFCENCGTIIEDLGVNKTTPEKLLPRKLLPCPSCNQQISQQAEQCPHCKVLTTQICQICGNGISIWSKQCPMCGDPEPFN
jgi:hypothetical protein